MPELLPEDFRPAADALAGRVIVVTGATGAIGGAVARAAAAHGALVVLVGRTVRKLEAVYDDITGAGHAEPAIYPMNLAGAVPADYDEFGATVRRELGRLDGIAHCAAALSGLCPLESLDPAEWGMSVQVNLHAPYLLTRACLALLREAPDAAVVFSTDAVGRSGKAYYGPYAVSKFAIEGLAQVFAEELEANTAVRVNCLNPGPVRSPLRSCAFPAEDAMALPTPESVTPAYLYLLGPASAGITARSFDAQQTTR